MSNKKTEEEIKESMEKILNEGTEEESIEKESIEKASEKENCDVKTDEKKEPSEQDKIAELTEMLKRTQAEFINFRNREEKERKQLFEYSGSDVIKKILPVLDSFEMALKNTTDPEKFKQGMEMIFAQLSDVLKQEGLRPIECLGQKADPYKHDILLKGKSDKEEGTVIEELQKGYMYKDRVLRHTKVKVAE